MVLEFNNFVGYLQILGLKAKRRWISMSLLMLDTEGYGKILKQYVNDYGVVTSFVNNVSDGIKSKLNVSTNRNLIS